MLKCYMGHGGEPQEGAILIFAHTAREAKVVGWNTPSFIREVCDDEYIYMRVKLQKEPYLMKEANPQHLAADKPHAIECPTTCNGCGFWGDELNDGGYCEDCQEEITLNGG